MSEASASEAATGIDALPFRVFTEIAILAQLSQTAMARLLPDDILFPHFTVLNHLARLGDGKTPVSLANAFQVTKGAMTNTLQRLEARGLIALEPDARDGRAKRVFLTPEGRAVRERCVNSVTGLLAEISAAVGAETFETALPALQRLRVHMDRAR